MTLGWKTHIQVQYHSYKTPSRTAVDGHEPVPKAISKGASPRTARMNLMNENEVGRLTPPLDNLAGCSPPTRWHRTGGQSDAQMERGREPRRRAATGTPDGFRTKMLETDVQRGRSSLCKNYAD